MKRVMGISGLGEGGTMSTQSASIGWSIVIGVTALVFVGTLMLKPRKD